MTEMFGAVREATVRAQGVQHAFGNATNLMPVLFDIDLELTAGEVVINRLSGEADARCDRELVEVDGQWQVRPLNREARG